MCSAGSIHSYIGVYVLKYLMKYIVIPSYLYYVHTFFTELTHLIDLFIPYHKSNSHIWGHWYNQIGIMLPQNLHRIIEKIGVRMASFY